MQKKFCLAEAKKMSRWFQELLGVQDWTIKLTITDARPEWVPDEQGLVGLCSSSIRCKTVDIWVSPKRCNEESENPFVVLFHELNHVVFEDLNVKVDDRLEFTIDRYAILMWLLYKKEK